MTWRLGVVALCVLLAGCGAPTCQCDSDGGYHIGGDGLFYPAELAVVCKRECRKQFEQGHGR